MKQLLFTSMAVATLVATAALAHADTLIGSQVTYTGYYPDVNTAITVPITKTIDASVEFPADLIQPVGGTSLVSENIDVGANFIDLTYNENTTATSAIFNGDILEFDPSAPAITGVSLDPLSTFDASQIGLSFASHQVAVNESGLSFTPSSRILVDLSFAPNIATAPEPQTVGMILVGLVIACFGLRRRIKAHAD